MKRKECRREKEVVHRMQLDAAQGRNDQHEKEKEEQRHRRKETDAPRQWSGLQMFRHGHRDLVTGNQVLVIPIEDPPVRSLSFLRRGQCIVRKIYVLEVCGHLQREIAYLRDAVRSIVSAD